ncbi:hypothetical protein [Actinoplanes sp. NPDC049802]|uniref:hypothetical protein n=1 Tax=Actinoplanes sp. NPDC049802 TaxID=3154742 RepID=UPI0033D0066B
MKIDFLGRLVRGRLVLLVGALLIGLAGGAVLDAVDFDFSVSTAVSGLVLAFILGAISVLRSASLVARPGLPAFEVPADPVVILLAAGYTVICGRSLGGLGRADLVFPAAWTVLFQVLILVTFWTAALRGNGVRLRPEGIEDRQPFGSFFVPWDALGAPWASRPSGEKVTLVVADEGRVRRRGLRFGGTASLTRVGADPDVLARAVVEYASRPEQRAAIGTPGELERLRALSQH